MDPLSVGASVIAVVGATGKVVKGIHLLKVMQDAPRELDDLLTEVSQFELVVRASQRVNGSMESELGALLKTAQGLVTEFESLIEYKLTEPGSSNKVDRWQWIRSSKDVERLRVKLRDVTASLGVLVGVNTSLSMDQVSQAQNQILSAVAHLMQLVEESPATRAALTGSLGNFRQLTLEPVSQANVTGALTTRSKAFQPDETASVSVISVSKVPRATICTGYCSCKCHRFRPIGPPGILSPVFGHGYVQITGPFFRKTQCDTLLCKAHIETRVSAQYRLPQWLASRMLVMWLTTYPPYSPELLLRIPRVVDRGNPAFEAVSSDVESFKLAITKADCTPYDVDEYGFTLFSLLVYHRRYDLLLQLSHYPEYWNPSSVTASVGRSIWNDLIVMDGRFVAGEKDIRVREIVLRQTPHLFEFDEFIEGQNLTRIHQNVCGLSDVSLDVELQTSTNIDTLDGKGRSALWYAVAHRRHDYVKKLLQTGADPNTGDSPILRALEYPCDFAILEALLDYGASVDSCLDRWAYACYSGALARDELLVKHGLGPDYCGHGGETILMRLAQGSCDLDSSRLKQMIKFGSDTEITDEVGMTAIMHAAHCISAPAFGVLARAGARMDMITVKGSTILHLAVAHEWSWRARNIPELCEVFCDVDVTKLDLDAKDGNGHVAFDLLQIRNGPSWLDYCGHHGLDWDPPFDDRLEAELALEAELKAISALEKLLHHIQEIQGVPEADRYPSLGEYCSRIIEEEPVPGAWHVY